LPFERRDLPAADGQYGARRMSARWRRVAGLLVFNPAAGPTTKLLVVLARPGGTDLVRDLLGSAEVWPGWHRPDAGVVVGVGAPVPVSVPVTVPGALIVVSGAIGTKGCCLSPRRPDYLMPPE
jgi:hypothetical protein